MERTSLCLATLLIFCQFAVGQSQYKTLYNFGGTSTDGRGPNAGFAERNGQFFGTTMNGGANCSPLYPSCGTVFSIEQFYGTIAEAVIYNFCATGDPNTCTDGAYPQAGLVIDKAGNLYGTTTSGGAPTCARGCGIVFKLEHSGATWKEIVLHQFDGTDGSVPSGQLTFDSAGNLYGMTSDGGAYGSGTVFELSPNTEGMWTEQTIHDFNPAAGDGSFPYTASVAFDSLGNLYGTTDTGGTQICVNGLGCGTVFELSPNGDGSWSETLVLSLDITLAFPQAGVTFDKKGNMYGTGFGGIAANGSLFRFTFQDGTWKQSSFIFGFDAGDGGPQAPLLLAGDVAYGTTYYNPSGSKGGEVFKFQNGTRTVLYIFGSGSRYDGNTPATGGKSLLLRNGTLYGATSQGGTFSGGTVFELTP